MITVALDAMGGDAGVLATVKGAAALSTEDSDIVVMLVGGLLSAVYLFRPLNAAFSGKDVPDIAPVPRKRQMLPLILALFATILGVASALPYEFLQIGRPGEAAEGIE